MNSESSCLDVLKINLWYAYPQAEVPNLWYVYPQAEVPNLWCAYPQAEVPSLWSKFRIEIYAFKSAVILTCPLIACRL
ncbi:hypothetical protein AVEN_142984-1 [Araneus ventricosus]|uniref:Uncharacterized protein n=1 Tax=Araneus ventricosus TaxID=182803 RepID=A0A4Y2X5B1_ARAVE|nr:hypothetical protein AVEN_142984-1 [Araneus ventricosus]